MVRPNFIHCRDGARVRSRRTVRAASSPWKFAIRCGRRRHPVHRTSRWGRVAWGEPRRSGLDSDSSPWPLEGPRCSCRSVVAGDEPYRRYAAQAPGRLDRQPADCGGRASGSVGQRAATGAGHALARELAERLNAVDGLGRIRSRSDNIVMVHHRFRADRRTRHDSGRRACGSCPGPGLRFHPLRRRQGGPRPARHRRPDPEA